VARKRIGRPSGAFGGAAAGAVVVAGRELVDPAVVVAGRVLVDRAVVPAPSLPQALARAHATAATIVAHSGPSFATAAPTSWYATVAVSRPRSRAAESFQRRPTA
jgi:hypothetical protein